MSVWNRYTRPSERLSYEGMHTDPVDRVATSPSDSQVGFGLVSNGSSPESPLASVRGAVSIEQSSELVQKGAMKVAWGLCGRGLAYIVSGFGSLAHVGARNLYDILQHACGSDASDAAKEFIKILCMSVQRVVSTQRAQVGVLEAELCKQRAQLRPEAALEAAESVQQAEVRRLESMRHSPHFDVDDEFRYRRLDLLSYAQEKGFLDSRAKEMETWYASKIQKVTTPSTVSVPR